MYEEDPYVFMSQYMVIPMAGRTTSFQSSWQRSGRVFTGTDSYGLQQHTFAIDAEHYDPYVRHNDLQDSDEAAPQHLPLEWMNKAIILDPAPSKGPERKQNPRARNGIVVVGKDAWDRNFHLESEALREDPVTVLHHIVALANKWHVYRVAIEEVNFSAIYAPLWTEILKHEHPDLHLEFIPLAARGRDKDQRITSLIPQMKQGFWYFNKPESGYTMQELVEFPHGETKDCIDALAYTNEVLVRGQTPEEMVRAKVYDRITDLGRSQYTGY